MKVLDFQFFWISLEKRCYTSSSLLEFSVFYSPLEFMQIRKRWISKKKMKKSVGKAKLKNFYFFFGNPKSSLFFNILKINVVRQSVQF